MSLALYELQLQRTKGKPAIAFEGKSPTIVFSDLRIQYVFRSSKWLLSGPSNQERV